MCFRTRWFAVNKHVSPFVIRKVSNVLFVLCFCGLIVSFLSSLFFEQSSAFLVSIRRRVAFVPRVLPRRNNSDVTSAVKISVNKDSIGSDPVSLHIDKKEGDNRSGKPTFPNFTLTTSSPNYYPEIAASHIVPPSAQSTALFSLPDNAQHHFRKHPISNKPFRSQIQPSNFIWRYDFPRNVTVELEQIPVEHAIAVGSEYVRWDKRRWVFDTHTQNSGELQRSQEKTAEPNRKIRRIWVWGERCSCTTAITGLLGENFHVPCNDSDPDNPKHKVSERNCVRGAPPWKHDFMRRADLSHQGETLHVMVTKHPYEWLDSMHRNPWWANFHKGRNMSTFLSLQWMSIDHKPQDHARFREAQSRLDRFISRFPPKISMRVMRRLLEAHGNLNSRFGTSSESTLSSTFQDAQLQFNTSTRVSIHQQLRTPPHGPNRLLLDRQSLKQKRRPDVAKRDGNRMDHGRWPDPHGVLRPMHNPNLRRNIPHNKMSKGGGQTGGTDAMILSNLKEMMSDRDPDTGERFPTILAMREAKLRDWVRVSSQLKYSYHISCRDFLLDSRAVLENVKKTFGLSKRRSLGPSEWNLGLCVFRFGLCVSQNPNANHTDQEKKRNHYLNGIYMKAFKEDDIAIANAWVDPEVTESQMFR